MKTKIVSFFSLLALCCAFMCGCMAKAIPFKTAQHYFVRNDVVGLPPATITTPAAFENYFGMAAVMGANGQPTEIDFNKEFVICITVEPTDIDTNLSVISLKEDKSGQLVLRYKIDRGEKRTYTTQPLVLLIVDKKYEMPVKLEVIK